MKKFAAFMAIVVAVMFSAGLVVGADAPGKITIKEIQKTKPPVEFDHKAHQGKVKECKTCHHKGEAGKEEKCSKCHKNKAEGKTVDLKEAFHKTCRDCHKKEKATTKCDGCHKK